MQEAEGEQDSTLTQQQFIEELATRFLLTEKSAFVWEHFRLIRANLPIIDQIEKDFEDRISANPYYQKCMSVLEAVSRIFSRKSSQIYATRKYTDMEQRVIYQQQLERVQDGKAAHRRTTQIVSLDTEDRVLSHSTDSGMFLALNLIRDTGLQGASLFLKELVAGLAEKSDVSIKLFIMATPHRNELELKDLQSIEYCIDHGRFKIKYKNIYYNRIEIHFGTEKQEKLDFHTDNPFYFTTLADKALPLSTDTYEKLFTISIPFYILTDALGSFYDDWKAKFLDNNIYIEWYKKFREQGIDHPLRTIIPRHPHHTGHTHRREWVNTLIILDAIMGERAEQEAKLSFLIREEDERQLRHKVAAENISYESRTFINALSLEERQNLPPIAYIEREESALNIDFVPYPEISAIDELPESAFLAPGISGDIHIKLLEERVFRSNSRTFQFKSLFPITQINLKMLEDGTTLNADADYRLFRDRDNPNLYFVVLRDGLSNVGIEKISLQHKVFQRSPEVILDTSSLGGVVNEMKVHFEGFVKRLRNLEDISISEMVHRIKQGAYYAIKSVENTVINYNNGLSQFLPFSDSSGDLHIQCDGAVALLMMILKRTTKGTVRYVSGFSLDRGGRRSMIVRETHANVMYEENKAEYLLDPVPIELAQPTRNVKDLPVEIRTQTDDARETLTFIVSLRTGSKLSNLRTDDQLAQAVSKLHKEDPLVLILKAFLFSKSGRSQEAKDILKQAQETIAGFSIIKPQKIPKEFRYYVDKPEMLFSLDYLLSQLQL